MKPIAAVPMIALTRSQDNVEAINKALRNAGHPVHVTWLPDARDLGDALTQASAEMLMLEKSVRGGIGRDAIKHQLAFAVLRQSRHRQPVTEVAPG